MTRTELIEAIRTAIANGTDEEENIYVYGILDGKAVEGYVHEDDVKAGYVIVETMYNRVDFENVYLTEEERDEALEESTEMTREDYIEYYRD